MIDEGIYLGGYTQKKALNVRGDIQGLGGEVTQLRRRVNSKKKIGNSPLLSEGYSLDDAVSPCFSTRGAVDALTSTG